MKRGISEKRVRQILAEEFARREEHRREIENLRWLLEQARRDRDEAKAEIRALRAAARPVDA